MSERTKRVRVRFAPSPTGYLHIGGARTAIYNWIFARKHKGDFILRIEDTDAERSTAESIEGILDGLRWLGIDWDEGPYFQSANIDAHKKAAMRLIELGHAYRCFCTKEELDTKRDTAKALKQPYKYDRTCRDLSPAKAAEMEARGIPYVVRFKTPDSEDTLVFNDLVYGPIEKHYDDIEDFVILRSDGSPLYLLSNAVDDMNDGITHVIRGQDGLANTPRQILIYKALGMQPPEFAHMPLTLDLRKQKISKRTHGEVVSVQFYREHGFLPWALVNFLVLLGWHTPDDREIFTREELIEAFSLEGVSRANSIFNYRPGDPKFFTDPKAISINAHYIRTMPIEDLAGYVKEELKATGCFDPEYDGPKRHWFLETLDLIRARYHTLKDFATLGRAYFSDEFSVDEKAFAKNILKHPDLREWLPVLAERLSAIPIWDQVATEAAIRGFIDETGASSGVIINAVRTVVTGQSVGPGLFDCLVAIGRERVVKRLKNAPLLIDNHLD
ncbi:MAG: glutamate--tRNA ligase [Dissulfurimicrobium hydrothermale]|uniref:glutamate--tRNA ligase n=2 Tax=Dissulfurimicrobium TaxID=1769732 RepID=UPI003C76A685